MDEVHARRDVEDTYVFRSGSFPAGVTHLPVVIPPPGVLRRQDPLGLLLRQLQENFLERLRVEAPYELLRRVLGQQPALSHQPDLREKKTRLTPQPAAISFRLTLCARLHSSM